MTEAQPKCLAVATVSNDGPYLIEWVAYWRAIGIAEILLFSHGCEDGAYAMLDRLEELGHITHAPLPPDTTRPLKATALETSKHPAYARADWVILAEIEDFPNIRLKDGTLQDLLADYGAADAVSLPVRRFAEAETQRDDLQIALRETAETPAHMHHRRQRTLFLRASRPARLGLRAPLWPEESEPLVVTLDPSVACINHYCRPGVLGENDTAGWAREASIQAHLDDVLPKVGELHNDPVLRPLHSEAVCWHGNGGVNIGMPAAAPLLPASPKEVAIKAPLRHANRRKMLSALPQAGRGAEIGVWEGAFSADILEIAKPEEFVMIDPWDLLADTPPHTHTHRKHSDRVAMAEMHAAVLARFSALPNVTIRKGFSTDVLASYPDNYFDWVYIDGNHLYDFVRRDVEMSLCKVKSGGIIAGDDYSWERDGRAHVRDGVLDAMREWGRVDRPRLMGGQYLITVDK